MSAPIQWLEDQLDRANRELEKAQQQFEEAQTLLQAAKKRLEASSEMLAIAKREQETEIRSRILHKREQGGIRPKVSMPDHMAALLKEHGPLKSFELFQLLKEQGWEKTSVNSVNTQLSRHKATRFNKNEEGQWVLIETA